MSKIDKVIEYFRALKEDAAMGPTMSTGSIIGGAAGFSSDANDSGPVAGRNKKMGFLRRPHKNIDYETLRKILRQFGIKSK